MSFAEVLAEIPQLTLEQRRELLRRVLRAEQESPSDAAAFHPKKVNGRFILTAPRTIRQDEVEAILEDLL